MSSLAVAVPAQTDGESDSGNPFKTSADDAAIALEDDAFVDEWVREEVVSGKRPTGRWLEAQRVHVTGRRNLTQKRLRDAVNRLMGSGRFEEMKTGGPSNGKWLRPVDPPTGCAG